MSDKLILKTARLYEANLLADALTRYGVPFYRREESFSGVQFAMPAFPAQMPGVFFTVYVPPAAAEDARAVLAELPIDWTETGVWSSNPKPWARKLIYVYCLVAVVLFFCGLLWALIENLIEVFSK